MNLLFMKMKKPSKPFLFGLCFILLSVMGLTWSCNTLKTNLSKKESQRLSLYRQDELKDQSRVMERQERELMNYFGEAATLLLKDGFRFHQDSGLMANHALLHYQSHVIATESQRDTMIAEYLSEKYQSEEAQLKTEEIVKRKRSAVSYWWLLLLLPVFWLIGKRRL